MCEPLFLLRSWVEVLQGMLQPGAHSLCRHPEVAGAGLLSISRAQPRGSRHSTASTAKHSFPCLDKKFLFSSPCNFNTAFWCYTTLRPSYTRHTHACHPSTLVWNVLSSLCSQPQHSFRVLCTIKTPIIATSTTVVSIYYLANFFLLHVCTTCTFP